MHAVLVISSVSFLTQQDVTRFSVLSVLHRYGFADIKTANIIPSLELLALTRVLTGTVTDSSEDCATICGCLICLDSVINCSP